MRLFICLIFCTLSFPSWAQLSDSDLISVYATFQKKQTHNNITINYLARNKTEQPPNVYFSKSPGIDPNSKDLIRTETGFRIDLPKIDNAFVYSIELLGLEANTKYYFVTGDPENGYSDELYFQTLPDDDSPITLLQGGDMGPDSSIKTIPQTALLDRPDVIMIGGDIAYADGKSSKFNRWLQWFGHMNEVMISEEGRVIPLIVALGNHEVDFILGSPENKVPYYFRLFPQNGFVSYFSRKLGANNILLVLDTGHAYVPAGQQKVWMKRELRAEAATPNKLAMYHIPQYPGHRRFNLPPSSIIRVAWHKVFGDFGIDIAFENHDHVYKRTKMLKNNKVVESGGTVYVGDGCWGRKTRSIDSRWYLHASARGKHVWSAILENDRISLQASGENNLIYDDFYIDSQTERVVETLWYFRGLPRPLRDILVTKTPNQGL